MQGTQVFNEALTVGWKGVGVAQAALGTKGGAGLYWFIGMGYWPPSYTWRAPGAQEHKGVVDTRAAKAGASAESRSMHNQRVCLQGG